MNCKICNTHFSTKQSYKLHEESIHSNIRYDCQECGKQFTQKSSLTTHINGVHKGIKYKCKKCDNEYASASGRYNHNKLTHERITYKLEQCDKELIRAVKKGFVVEARNSLDTCASPDAVDEGRVESILELLDKICFTF